MQHFFLTWITNYIQNNFLLSQQYQIKLNNFDGFLNLIGFYKEDGVSK